MKRQMFPLKSTSQLSKLIAQDPPSTARFLANPNTHASNPHISKTHKYPNLTAPLHIDNKATVLQIYAPQGKNHQRNQTDLRAPKTKQNTNNNNLTIVQARPNTLNKLPRNFRSMSLKQFTRNALSPKQATAGLLSGRAHKRSTSPEQPKEKLSLLPNIFEESKREVEERQTMMVSEITKNAMTYGVQKSKVSIKELGTNGVIKAYAANSHQGIIRNYNEDRVALSATLSKQQSVPYFGVFDGHGGSTAADFLKDELHDIHQFLLTDPRRAILEATLQAQRSILEQSEKDQDFSGSCLVISLVVGRKLYIGNVGDSRAVVSEDRGRKVIQITEDHKPNDSKELARITQAGGTVYQHKSPIEGVEYPHRVSPGKLSVSRTLGDLQAKDKKYGGNPKVVIATPDVFEYEINQRSDFMLLASSQAMPENNITTIC